MRQINLLAIICLTILPPYLNAAVSSGFPPECPTKGTHEEVYDPSAWADTCFRAITGRNPNPAYIGESMTLFRDMDLDGENERLEVRGTGNSVKQIYVFQAIGEQYFYLGELDAHYSFEVVDIDGEPVIEYIYRLGADHFELVRLKYVSNEFIEVSRRPISQ